MDFFGLEKLAALPIGLGFTYFMYRLANNMVNQVITLATNHLSHNTEAICDLREAIVELTTYLQRGRKK